MRIAIVNDMKMTVEMLKHIIISKGGYELAWVACNGAEAVEKCAADTPDLILMDLVMPIMNGVEATELIMKNTPCAILLVTASFTNNVSLVFNAMGFGALDVVKTPILDMKRSTFGGDELLFKIEKIAYLIGKGHKKEPGKPLDVSKPNKEHFPRLLIIGSSTGGPKAIIKVLSSLPSHPPFAIVIIQHVDQQFAPSFASWLESQISQKVQIAQDNMRITEGSVLIAGKNEHLLLNESNSLHYSKHPKDNPFRPSVDVFFSSVANHWPNKFIGILLTGMGSDGAKGMKTLMDSGWYTIAEHQSSCVVYGMPKAAIEANAASSILPIEEIGPAVLSYTESQNHRQAHAPK
jgi:two-component system, chemotaxis family, response regulator WspF